MSENRLAALNQALEDAAWEAANLPRRSTEPIRAPPRASSSSGSTTPRLSRAATTGIKGLNPTAPSFTPWKPEVADFQPWNNLPSTPSPRGRNPTSSLQGNQTRLSSRSQERIMRDLGHEPSPLMRELRKGTDPLLPRSLSSDKTGGAIARVQDPSRLREELRHNTGALLPLVNMGTAVPPQRQVVYDGWNSHRRRQRNSMSESGSGRRPHSQPPRRVPTWAEIAQK